MTGSGVRIPLAAPILSNHRQWSGGTREDRVHQSDEWPAAAYFFVSWETSLLKSDSSSSTSRVLAIRSQRCSNSRKNFLLCRSVASLAFSRHSPACRWHSAILSLSCFERSFVTEPL